MMSNGFCVLPSPLNTEQKSAYPTQALIKSIKICSQNSLGDNPCHGHRSREPEEDDS